MAVGGVGGAAAVYSTSNGGAFWSQATLPATQAPLLAVSCPSTKVCVAVRGIHTGTSARADALYSADGGASWSAGTLPPALTEPDNDSDDPFCPSSSRCVVVGSGTTQSGQGVTLALYSTNSGASWQETKLPTTTTYQLDSVACPTASSCVAVGGLGSSGTAGMALFCQDGGATWALGTVPATVQNLAAVSCLSATVCAAVVGFGGPQTGSSGPSPGGAVFTHDGGASWS